MPSMSAGSTFLHVRWNATPNVEGTPDHFVGHRLADSATGSDGIFAEWAWDGTSRRARNDRYGLHPLFYFTRPGKFCLSTSVDTLLERGVPRDLHWEALTVFMRLGFLLASDTPFAGIKAVPPRSTTVESRRLEHR